MSSSLTLLPNRYCIPTRLLSKRFSSKTLTLTLTLNAPNPSLHHYGPSLFKSPNPNPNPNPNNDSIDRSSFSRAFDIPALRVPAADCSSLERRLRGHLLNWPRVRNVARSPGDEIDPEIKHLLVRDRVENDTELGPLDPVLYRDKLAKGFNCQGFVKFRNLAKISRPKKKKKKGEGEVEERGERENCYEFEVVGSVGSGEEEMKGLLGEGFGDGGRWRGPTRLLLLDERYTKRGEEELPEAIKVALISL